METTNSLATAPLPGHLHGDKVSSVWSESLFISSYAYSLVLLSLWRAWFHLLANLPINTGVLMLCDPKASSPPWCLAVSSLYRASAAAPSQLGFLLLNSLQVIDVFPVPNWTLEGYVLCMCLLSIVCLWNNGTFLKIVFVLLSQPYSECLHLKPIKMPQHSKR